MASRTIQLFILSVSFFIGAQLRAQVLSERTPEQLRERYQSYKQWVAEYEKALRSQGKGVKELKEERRRHEAQMEKARLEQIRTRKPYREDDEKKEEEMRRSQALAWEKIRKDYLRHRDEVRRRAQNVPQVPDNFEAGLERPQL